MKGEKIRRRFYNDGDDQVEMGKWLVWEERSQIAGDVLEHK